MDILNKVMEIFLAALIFLALALFLMCFNIIFRKNGRFPDSEIGHNQELRKRGIVCAKEDELKLWKKNRRNGESGCTASSCADCTSGNCLK